MFQISLFSTENGQEINTFEIIFIFIYDISQDEVTKQEISEASVEAEQPTMAPVQLGCPMGSAACEYKTEEVETESALQLLEMHTRLAHPHQVQAPTTSQVKTGKIVSLRGRRKNGRQWERPTTRRWRSG